jgi:hypothetical protein
MHLYLRRRRCVWEQANKQCIFTVFRDLPTSSSSPHFVWGRYVAHPQICLPTGQVRRHTFQFPTKGDAVLHMQTGPGSTRLSALGKEICTIPAQPSEVMATRVRNVWGCRRNAEWRLMKPMCQKIQLGIHHHCAFCVRQCHPVTDEQATIKPHVPRTVFIVRVLTNVAEGWPHASRKTSVQEKFEKSVLTALGHPSCSVEAKSTLTARRNLRTGMSPLWNKMICTRHQIMGSVRPLASWPFDCLENRNIL